MLQTLREFNEVIFLSQIEFWYLLIIVLVLAHLIYNNSMQMSFFKSPIDPKYAACPDLVADTENYRLNGVDRSI